MTVIGVDRQRLGGVAVAVEVQGVRRKRHVAALIEGTP